MAFTYNDPVVFVEYAMDVAEACRARGVKTISVSAGYMCDAPRAEFYRHIDAANIDLKALTEGFYRKLCTGSLGPVLETLAYLKHETPVWLEITTLLIEGENDSPMEVEALSAWILEHLGPDVPLHFTAFHPDWKMLDRASTTVAALKAARSIAQSLGSAMSTAATFTTRRRRAPIATLASHRSSAAIGTTLHPGTLATTDAAGAAVRPAPVSSTVRPASGASVGGLWR